MANFMQLICLGGAIVMLVVDPLTFVCAQEKPVELQQLPFGTPQLKPPTQTDATPIKSDSQRIRDFWPMVNVAKNENRSNVEVHVPLVFDMTNNFEGKNGKLDLSVLSGLVTVSRDKERLDNGLTTGPVTVTIFGIPIYSGIGSRRDKASNTAPESRSKNNINLEQATNSIDPLNNQRQQPVNLAAVNNSSNKQTNGSEDFVGKHLITSIKKTNENVLRSLSDILGRSARYINERAEPIANVNGRPADNSRDNLVKPSRFSQTDLEPRMLKVMNTNSINEPASKASSIPSSMPAPSSPKL